MLFFSLLACDVPSSLRIEVEACNLKEKVEKMKETNPDENFVKSPKETASVAIEVSLCVIHGVILWWLNLRIFYIDVLLLDLSISSKYSYYDPRHNFAY